MKLSRSKIIVIVLMLLLIISVFINAFFIASGHKTNFRAIAQFFTGEPQEALQMHTFYPNLTATPTPLPPSTTLTTDPPIPIETIPAAYPAIPAVNEGEPQTPSASPPGQSVSTGCAQSDIQKLVDSVSEDKIKEYLESLVDNDSIPGKDERQSRHVSNPGNAIETAYIKSVFETNGIESYYQDFTTGKYTLKNIIGKIPGKTPNEYYLVGGHMDAITSSKNPAPGADDNGSGTVATLEAARVLKSFAPCLNKSIEFIAWNAEEIGLVGSAHYVKNLGNKVIKGYFDPDKIGTTNGGPECIHFQYKAYNGGDILANKLAEVNTKYNINLNGIVGETTRTNSDHANFWRAGLPAVFVYNCAISPVYHKENDQTSFLTYSQMVKVTKTLVAVLAELAMQ